jgi:hypothetical protein
MTMWVDPDVAARRDMAIAAAIALGRRARDDVDLFARPRCDPSPMEQATFRQAHWIAFRLGLVLPPTTELRWVLPPPASLIAALTRRRAGDLIEVALVAGQAADPLYHLLAHVDELARGLRLTIDDAERAAEEFAWYASGVR